MYIRQLIISHFRGFSNITLKPSGNVVLMGEPGAGRSDIISAISKVLDPNVIRTGTTTELDFHQRNVAEPIEIEVVIGGLGTELEQHFLDCLEIWDMDACQILEDCETLEDVAGENHEWILRLAYRGQWLAEQEHCEERVYYPKYSDTGTQSFRNTRLTDIERLGFTRLSFDSGKILALGTHGIFRRIVQRSPGGDFASALAEYVQEVTAAATRFTTSNQVKLALGEVIASLHEILRIQPADISQHVAFSPEGGSPSGLLRSLGPTIDLGSGGGFLPAWRQGSTIGALFRLAESLALSSGSENIVAIDDLGDGMDSASATHFGAIIRRMAGQAWITTRLPSVAEIFEPVEVIRLHRLLDGTRSAYQGNRPTTRSEAIAAKHWHRNLLPVFSYHSVIVVEGPHDLSALHALAIRLCNEGGGSLPATHCIAIISAGATGSGGYSSVLRVAAAAKEMGLYAVGLVDGDTTAGTKEYIESHTGDADAIVRLPDDIAIERAIVQGIPDTIIRQALRDISTALQLSPLPNLDDMPAGELEARTIEYIKRNALHAAFIEALPFDNLPPLAKALLEKAISAAREQLSGFIQL